MSLPSQPLILVVDDGLEDEQYPFVDVDDENDDGRTRLAYV
jgi:hypothetical protein